MKYLLKQPVQIRELCASEEEELGDNMENIIVKYHIVYEDEHGPHTCIIEESKLNMILRRLIQSNCYICELEKL